MPQDPDLVAFAEMIKEKRTEMNLSQNQLIAEIDGMITVAQLSNIECARNWPSGPVIYALCRVLKMQIPANTA